MKLMFQKNKVNLTNDQSTLSSNLSNSTVYGYNGRDSSIDYTNHEAAVSDYAIYKSRNEDKNSAAISEALMKALSKEPVNRIVMQHQRTANRNWEEMNPLP